VLFAVFFIRTVLAISVTVTYLVLQNAVTILAGERARLACHVHTAFLVLSTGAVCVAIAPEFLLIKYS